MEPNWKHMYNYMLMCVRDERRARVQLRVIGPIVLKPALTLGISLKLKLALRDGCSLRQILGMASECCMLESSERD